MLRLKAFNRCRDRLPRLNPDLCEGLVVKQSKAEIEKAVNDAFHCISSSFPPGLIYVGMRDATPEEQLREITKKRRQVCTYDISQSDTYYTVCMFEFNGIREERFLLLPYFRRGGIFRLNGSTFVASPVVADINFSIEPNSIFMQLTRTRLTFNTLRYQYTMCHDGTYSNVPFNLVVSKIFNASKDDSSKRQCATLHYLLAKLGVTETLVKHFNIKENDFAYGDDAIVNVKNYPEDEWIILKSRGIRPKTMPKTQYIPTNVQFAVRQTALTPYVGVAIGSIFYIIDHEPEIAVSEYMDNPMMWRRILIRFIKNKVDSERKAVEEMDAHIASVDTYLDSIVKRRLASEGYDFHDIYDVFEEIIKKFDQLTILSEPADLLSRQLETTRFILYDIISKISKLLFELIKLKDDRLNIDFIRHTFNQKFPREETMRLGSGHGEITTLDSATDCFLFSATRRIVPQTRASVRQGAKAKKALEMTDPAYALHASQMYVNTYLFITKGAPSAREAVNHFLKLDNQYRPSLTKDQLMAVERLQDLLQVDACGNIPNDEGDD